jgi:hypothetical protein
VTSSLDILRKEKDGILWIGTAATLEEAHSQISADAGSNAVEYIIYNAQTGHRITVNLGGGSDN